MEIVDLERRNRSSIVCEKKELRVGYTDAICKRYPNMHALLTLYIIDRPQRQGCKAYS